MTQRISTRMLSTLGRPLDTLAQRLMRLQGAGTVDFSQPPGEAALVGPQSLSWQIFKNPVALFVGGVSAVILELAEPAVRTGVWEHTSFRTDPMQRLQRTGLAAMVTVYGPRSVAEARIAKVVRMHAQIRGFTPSGEGYGANDVALLNWVQATATYGFEEAYSRFVQPLNDEQLSQVFEEGAAAAQLYGALGAPRSSYEWRGLLESMRGRLEPSPILFEFLQIMKSSPVLPRTLRPLQRLMVRAAVEITPPWVRECLGLDRSHGLGPSGMSLLRFAGTLADRIMLRSSPAVQSCRRLGLPEHFLYERAGHAVPR
jgi:uncharacterized protein (DUF2236 family)